MRLPVEGDYDPLADKKAAAAAVGAQPGSELYTAILSGIKPANSQPFLRQQEDGSYVFIDRPGSGIPSGIAPTGQPSISPGVIQTGVKGKTTPTETVRTGQHFYVDNDNNLREVPYTTTTKRITPLQAVPPNTPHPSNVGPQLPAPPTGGTTAGGGASGKVIGPTKLSQPERATLQVDQQITGFANEVIPQIEQAGLQQANGVQDSLRGMVAWGEYKAGRVPSDPFYASIIRPVAAISIAGAAPWVRIGRNKYTFDVIQQHLPHPWQTPARIYDNVKWLRDNVVPSSERSILGPVSKARQNQPPAANAPPQAGSQSPTSWEQTATSADGKTKIGLRKGKWFNIATGQEMK